MSAGDGDSPQWKVGELTMTEMMTTKSRWAHDSDDDGDGHSPEREELVTGELKA